MTNNIILRQLRYTFDFKDEQMIKLFAEGGMEVKRGRVNDWLKKEEHEDFRSITDAEFATFLNGFINFNRGKRDGPQAPPEERLNNNIIFRKLKIALNFKDTDIIDVLKRVDMLVSKHEISAIFRNPSQNQYRPCKDQFLRKFLHGLQLKYRPKDPDINTRFSAGLPQSKMKDQQD